jgi:hypothetical protein
MGRRPQETFCRNVKEEEEFASNRKKNTNGAIRTEMCHSVNTAIFHGTRVKGMKKVLVFSF